MMRTRQYFITGNNPPAATHTQTQQSIFSYSNFEGIRTTSFPKPKQRRTILTTVSAASKFSANSILKKCEKCGGKGSIDCPGCKGTGRNKKNGNMFERWKCFGCQGFGLKSCPVCGKGEGLTPEQRGER